MPTLATIDDYYAFRGEPVPVLTADEETALLAKLSRATTRVKYAIRLARYDRATDGLPASDVQRQALKDAVSAERDAIAAAGDDSTGVATEYDQISAIGVSFGKRSSSAVDWSPATSSLSPEARIILAEAGFFTTAVDH